MKSERLMENRVFKDVQEVNNFLAPLRAQGKKVVTTNGCFDIIHSGHVRYLTEAAGLGDLLVVGVNADETVARLKGPGRPVRKEGDRVLTVAALRMVDAAFIFREDDPRAFLDVLRPDVHVKGGDYTEDIIERETVERHGGRVAIVSYVKGCSTTSFVEKIRSGQR
jgi:rfaE bifunctional protein nucleotidyltransferase chain/domain